MPTATGGIARLRRGLPFLMCLGLLVGGPALAAKKKKKGAKKKGNPEAEKHLLLSLMGGVGGGYLDLYDDEKYRGSLAEDGFNATNAVGVGPAARLTAAVPILLSDDRSAVLCPAVEGRWDRTRYAQAPTTTALVGTNGGTSSSLVSNGETADLSYTVAMLGYGAGVTVSAKKFYGSIMAGKSSGTIETRLNGTVETTKVEGRYFSIAPGYRFRLSKHASLLAMAEGFFHPAGLIAEDPAVAFPLSDQVGVPAVTFTGLVGLRVDL